MIRLSLLLLLIPFATFSQEQNFDFEKLSVNGRQPAGWGLPSEAGNSYGYTVLTDTIAYSGKYSVIITKNGPYVQNGFGAMEYTVPAKFKGKKVLLEGYIRTENVQQGWAGLYMRIDGTRQFDNMQKRGITGTTEWKKYSIELELEEDAESIGVGALLAGEGKMWVDKLSLSVDEKDYSLAPPRDKKFPTAVELAWLKQEVIPLRSVDANTGFGDLARLKDMIGDARIVSLGEPTHGTSEAFRMKHRMLEYLVKEKDFNIFAIEANMPECNAINEYVLHGTGDPHKLLDTMYFWTWNAQEVLDMIVWMRDWNVKNPKKTVQFRGFDMQYPGAAASSLAGFVAEYAPAQKTLGDSIRSISIRLNVQKMRKPGKYNADDLKNSLSVLRSGLENDRQQLVLAAGSERYAWAVQYLKILEQWARLTEEGAYGASRDMSMAENTDWLAKQYPGSKLVLWAHNGHVNKTKTKMGGYLGTMYGKEMIVMGFTVAEGTYTAVEAGKGIFSDHVLTEPEDASFEWYGRNLGMGDFILDIRKEKLNDPNAAWLLKKHSMRRIGAVAMPKVQFYKLVIPDEYDAIIYLDKSRASQCFRAGKRAAI